MTIIMGLIREPENIDLAVIDKPWTDEEKKDFSELIKRQKESYRKSRQRIVKKKKTKIQTA